MAVIFKKIKDLELKIDSFLDLVAKGGFLFQRGVKYYMDGEMEDFEARLVDLDKTEHDADDLLHEIQNIIYVETLIPEYRGDVLSVLEDCDEVLNITYSTLSQFSVELPYILPEVKPLFNDLTDTSIRAIESMIAAIHAYFNDITRVREHINKVQMIESEADKIAEKLKRIVFKTDIPLSQKFHIRYLTLHIESISDNAEDLCDKLLIAAIKRTL